MIIGNPKSIDELPPFTAGTIEELAKGMNAQLEAGTPPEVPTMMPIGQLAQVARTLRDYHAIVAALVNIDVTEHPDELPEVLAPLQERAQALLDTPEPPPIKPASNLLVP